MFPINLDPEYIKYLSTLGVGGLLAAFMFMWYRRDILLKHTEAEKREQNCEKREDQLVEVIKSNTMSHEKLSHSIQTLSDALKQAETSRIQQLQMLLERALQK